MSLKRGFKHDFPTAAGMNRKFYRKLFLRGEEFGFYDTGNEERRLSNLGRINIFIGPNNSGKSRFLRSLFFAISQYHPLAGEIDFEEINSAIVLLNKKVGDLKLCSEKYKADFVSKLNESGLDNFERLAEQEPIFEWLEGFGKHLNNFTTLFREHFPQRRFGANSQLDLENIFAEIGAIASISIKKWEKLANHIARNGKRHRIYVPTMRGLRGYGFVRPDVISDSTDFYALRTRKDYFESGDNNEPLDFEIFSGLSIYDKAKEMLLGNQQEREAFSNFEDFIGNTFFEGRRFSIIPKIKDDVVHIKIGEEEDFPIHQLGDGIQSLIILLFPLFMNKDRNLSVFFEEPDQNLHPAFQRIFIEALSRDEFSRCQVFMTTHSNHFLDFTTDFDGISVYSFQSKGEGKNKKFHITNVQSPDLNLLEALGVRNSSVFLSNCTIWVEGITDRIYIRKYLELYQESVRGNFKEDLHYSFVEYGGGNITHWSFLDSKDPNHRNINVKALCGRLFLITDRDGTNSDDNPAKAKRIEFLEENLGKDQFYCWDCREIENSLSHKTIVRVIKEKEGENATNLVFDDFHKNSYKEEGLGKFIEKNIFGLSRKYAASGGTGTIQDKLGFAKTAVMKLEHIGDLSEEANRFIEKLYAFIQKNNK